MNTRRKIYTPDAADADAPTPCPRCGCRHRHTLRAYATPNTVKIVKICRNCGFETAETP